MTKVKARNFVAKHAYQYNKATVHDCRKTKIKNGYQKHRKQVKDYLTSLIFSI